MPSDPDPTAVPDRAASAGPTGPRVSCAGQSGRPSERARAVGLVLGAGGVPGYAFHVGALAALADHGQWDARSAELIVGTSAGAGIASLLRAGLSPADLYAHTLGRRLSPEGDALLARLPGAAWDSGAERPGRPGPASVTLAARGLLRWPPRPGVMLAGALPRGRRSPTPLGDRHRAVHTRWPDAALWLCAVRLGDGRRTVFGRDDHPPLGVGTAVEASCAVPGRFDPVAVGDEHYLDGGTWSSTNADLVARLGFDAVVIVAPLSTPHPVATTPRRLATARRGRGGSEPGRLVSRAYHRAVLEAEVRRVVHAGTPVITIEPTEDDLVLLDGPGPDGRVDVAEAAYASVTDRLREDRDLAVLLTARVPA